MIIETWGVVSAMRETKNELEHKSKQLTHVTTSTYRQSHWSVCAVSTGHHTDYALCSSQDRLKTTIFTQTGQVSLELIRVEMELQKCIARMQLNAIDRKRFERETCQNDGSMEEGCLRWIDPTNNCIVAIQVGNTAVGSIILLLLLQGIPWQRPVSSKHEPSWWWFHLTDFWNYIWFVKLSGSIFWKEVCNYWTFEPITPFCEDETVSVSGCIDLHGTTVWTSGEL